MEFLFTFPNVHYAIHSEKYLTAQQILVKVVPLPASLGDFCGVCLRINEADLAKSYGLLTDEGVPIKAIFKIEKHAGERKYQKWTA